MYASKTPTVLTLVTGQNMRHPLLLKTKLSATTSHHPQARHCPVKEAGIS